MIYVFGVPTAVAAGTELYLAIFMGAFGALNYAFEGYVDIRLTLLLFLGSLVGVYIGVYGVKVVSERYIRLSTGFIILFCVVCRAIAVPVYLRQLGWVSFDPAWDPWFNRRQYGHALRRRDRWCRDDPVQVAKAHIERRRIHTTLLVSRPAVEELGGGGPWKDDFRSSCWTTSRSSASGCSRPWPRSGCDVEVFEVPGRALERIEAKRFDVVVTDIRMDEIDGIEVLEKVLARWPETRVIMITGCATVEVAREAMAKGAFDFIAKPFKPQELRDVIAKAAEALGFPGIARAVVTDSPVAGRYRAGDKGPEGL